MLMNLSLDRLKLLCAASAILLTAAGCSGKGPSRAEGRLYFTVVDRGQTRIEWMDSEGGNITYVAGAMPSTSNASSANKKLYEKRKSEAEANALPARQPSVSFDGKKMVYTAGSGRTDLRVINLAGGQEEMYIKNGFTLDSPCFSRDVKSSRLVYRQTDDDGEETKLLVKGISAGSKPVEIMSADNLSYPSWSNFGHNIFFCYMPSENGTKLYSQDYTKPDSESKEIMQDVSQVSMAPIGSRTAVISNGRLGICDMAGGNRKMRLLVSDPGCSSPAWSPSGDRIAFVHNEAIEIISADGGEVKVLKPKNYTILDVCWAPGL